MDKSKIQIRFFDNMRFLNMPIGSSGLALLHCNEIHLDTQLKQRPAELKKTLEHEYGHFEILEQSKGNMPLFWARSLWFDLCQSRKRQILLLFVWLFIIVVYFWGKWS